MSLNLENTAPVRIFNEDGVVQFRTYLQRVKIQETNDLPTALLFDSTLTQIVDRRFYVEYRSFNTTADIVRYLHPIIQQVPLPDKFYNTGLWAWLSAFYFDVVCPLEKGERKPGEEARHIPPKDRNFRESYRHLIAAPLRMYDTHGEKSSRLFLYPPPHQRSEFLREIMGVQGLANNHGVLEALHTLYFDEETEYPKRGVLAKEDNKPGVLRRFVSILNQLNVTYDLQAMSGQQILDLLPRREFGRWMNR